MICSICGVNETDNPDEICEWREMGYMTQGSIFWEGTLCYRIKKILPTQCY